MEKCMFSKEQFCKKSLFPLFPLFFTFNGAQITKCELLLMNSINLLNLNNKPMNFTCWFWMEKAP